MQDPTLWEFCAFTATEELSVQFSEGNGLFDNNVLYQMQQNLIRNRRAMGTVGCIVVHYECTVYQAAH